jgi:uncharacterized repeat protein (TIGR01451 family)
MKKVLLVLVLVAVAMVLIAKPPAAGTQIKNQAVATFIDQNGITRSVLSNQVVTNVLPVYAVNVTPDIITHPGASGGEMMFQFEVINNGNTGDTFIATPSIEPNSTFTPINPEIFYDENGNGKVDPGETLWNDSFVNIGAGEFRYLIVKYSIPANISSGSTATVYLDLQSTNDPAAYDYNNEARSEVYNDAVVTIYKKVTPAQVSAGDNIQYVISGSNVGNKTASILVITDVLNNNIEFTSFGSVSPGGATTNYDSGTHTITVNISALNPGDSFSIQINASVKSTTLSGYIENIAQLTYDTQNLGSVERNSNIATLQVGGAGFETAKVWIGPAGNPEASEIDDTQVATAVAGTFVNYTNTIKNAGNATDTIELLIDGVLPEGLEGAFTVLFYGDELTPLPDTDDDGNQDIGPLSPGEVRDIEVKFFLPSDITSDDATVTIRALSSLDHLASDTTKDVARPIVTPEMLVGNASETAEDTVVDTEPVYEVGEPGSYVDFPIDIVNNGGAPDSYALSGTVPANWTIRFYLDTDGDGVLDQDELIPVTSTNQIPANSGTRIIARISIPNDALYTGNDEQIIIKANSTSNTEISDSQENYIKVARVYEIVLAPSRNGSAVPGGTVQYEHTITNTGNASETIKLIVDSTWSYTFMDLEGNPISTEQTFELNPGESMSGKIQFSVPSDAPLGSAHVAYMTAEVQEDTSVTSRITDITLVTTANVTLSKTVDKANAEPGEILTYEVSYENVGTEIVQEFTLYDVIPFYTKLFSGGTFNPSPTGYSTDFGATWANSWPPANYSAVTNIKWIIGEVYPGDSGTVMFQVQIEQ